MLFAASGMERKPLTPERIGELLHEGVERFNDRRFWDAHESWEGLWLAIHDDERQFFQGLIQLAAAYHHVQRGTFRGGVRLFDAALARLAHFPAGHRGIDRAEAESAARVHREFAAEAVSDGSPGTLSERDYPRLHMTDLDVSNHDRR